MLIPSTLLGQGGSKTIPIDEKKKRESIYRRERLASSLGEIKFIPCLERDSESEIFDSTQLP